MQVTPAILYAIAPSARPEYVNDIVKYWPEFARRYKLSDADVPHSLAHIAAETGGFNRLEESLYYTTVKRLRQVWPSRFRSDAAAQPYVRNPEKLANLVYGGRYGNNNVNDGWLYRGSGCKQTTFKANYAAVEAATAIRCVASPHLLRTFPAALESAMVYWRDRGLSRIVAAGGDVVTKLTKAIQGGTGGLADRRTYTARALSAWTGAGGVATKPVDPVKRSSAMLRRTNNYSDAVKALQLRLIALGYDSVGRADGIFGGATEDAVKLLQARNGLVADGVVGPATARALETNNRADYRDPVPLREPSGLDRFLAWLFSLFNPR